MMRCGVPPATGIVYSSQIGVSHDGMNATVLSSGETAYLICRWYPGGPKSARHFFSPVESENTTIPNDPVAEHRSIINIWLPSANHAKGDGRSYWHWTLVNFRSVPPSAGATYTPSFFPSHRV